MPVCVRAYERVKRLSLIMIYLALLHWILHAVGLFSNLKRRLVWPSRGSGYLVKPFEHNIIIVGPSEFIGTFTSLFRTWRNEKNRAQNAIEIARQAGCNVRKFSGLCL